MRALSPGGATAQKRGSAGSSAVTARYQRQMDLRAPRHGSLSGKHRARARLEPYCHPTSAGSGGCREALTSPPRLAALGPLSIVSRMFGSLEMTPGWIFASGFGSSPIGERAPPDELPMSTICGPSPWRISSLTSNAPANPRPHGGSRIGQNSRATSRADASGASDGARTGHLSPA